MSLFPPGSIYDSQGNTGATWWDTETYKYYSNVIKICVKRYLDSVRIPFNLPGLGHIEVSNAKNL